MKLQLCMALIALAQTPEPAPAPAKPEPWTDTIAAGLGEVRRLAGSGQAEEARALCERLLAPNDFLQWKERMLAANGWRRAVARVVEPACDALGLAGAPAPLRAEVLYAAGVVAAGSADRAHADQDFGRSQALAGPGTLRLAAGYQLGTTALLEGESWRAKIPEIQAKNGQAPAPPAPAGASAGALGGEPDPLAQARAAYQLARERFIERLSAEWDDADTRANVELVQKRLHELDQLEQQRQEQQQKQQQDKNQDPNQQKQDEKDPNQKQDPQKQDEKQQDPKDPQASDEQKKKEEEQKQQEEQKKKDEQAQKDAQKQAQADPSKTQEQQLSKEEMTRLLDMLQQREEQWKRLQAQLQHARRARARRDW